ncbi:hypothetical protein ABEG17_18335 [Pedococcus sp. KACC 23699]|uniref:Uncharacterized protein n=1 Tax=Pedococcus sp. KACC 23699 TaxID=3149228 RepID=A0AAU7JSU9_9MICO
MTELPASVRLSLWITHAWATGAPQDAAVRRALPDIDHVDGDLDRLTVWRELGEQALLVSLPAPGDLAGLPRASADALGAAAAGGEAVFVPALGGMLVPSISSFGNDVRGGLDVGTRVDWTAYDSEPVPRHRVEALEASQLERHLREELRVATEHLDALGGQPFAASAARELADAALGGRWGLPSGLPGRAAQVIALAGTVGHVVDVALAAGDGALNAATAASRHSLLMRLQRAADHALADATNAACAVLAGWRPA